MWEKQDREGNGISVSSLDGMSDIEYERGRPGNELSFRDNIDSVLSESRGSEKIGPGGRLEAVFRRARRPELVEVVIWWGGVERVEEEGGN